MKKLFDAVSNDVFAMGQIDNCRWLYSPTDNPLACGVLSLATASNFDRWANSRIAQINTILFEPDDPDFEEFVTKIVELF